MSSVLKFENISYWYEDGKKILENINLDFEKGKFYTIIGPSGSGKTTFLSIASGLDKAKSGEVSYDGTLVSKIGLSTFRNKYVSIIFQGYNLLNYMSAIENVVSAMEIKNIKNKEKKKVALEMLDRVGISKDLANKKVLKLSGGQQQRVAIARALVSESDLIIADEPTGNLDEKTSNDIITLIKDLVRDYNKTVVMVTHNKDIAKKSDEVYQLKNKTLILVG
ncbi:ABC transporter ATP-binding protein [uncultured Clostridium sp.]|jgi:putative ABC transport system ATP-binding protein|uniref:ABC transporter ATP-binding protein n=1 Tax=uncultured Clostridium sp. TaxID=59620 RepID=UPI0026221C1E|nr:ABC transporter ATP-binding protein [uncultured Clostridium sp.]